MTMAAPRNYIVLRRSPDWTTFDLEQTRQFLAEFPLLPNDMIIRFAERWDRASTLDYQTYRQAMKSLSLATVGAVRDAVVVSHADLDAMAVHDEDLLFFTDDDDWVSPDLLERLRREPAQADGWLWPSIFVGKLFADTPHEREGGAIVQERPASNTVYTNNYAVTGAAWNRLGAAALLEHYTAQQALDDGRFTPGRLDRYLTAANKHLCCTVSIHYNSAKDGFQDDLAGAIGQIIEELTAVRLTDRTAWIDEPLQAFLEINRRALGPVGSVRSAG